MTRALRWSISCLLVVLACGAALEVAARLYWRTRGVPVLHPERILEAFYPGLAEVDAAGERWTAAPIRILLLGGSTLNPRWSTVQGELREQLAFAGHPDVRIFNLAKPGLTSRDSRLIYEALGAERFDLVVVYDGINETRANNVPPEVFRDDYGHYGWYAILNALARHHGHARLALPLTLEYFARGLHQRWAPERYAPRNQPRADWIGYGAWVRSAEPFAANLRAILARAARRDEPVLLMTFATWVPEDYSLDAFRAGRLGYGLHLTPLELWGEPTQVQEALARHNDVVRALAAEHPDTGFVDQARLLAGDRRSFNDACHLTLHGAHRFVHNLLPTAVRTLDTRRLTEPAARVTNERR